MKFTKKAFMRWNGYIMKALISAVMVVVLISVICNLWVYSSTVDAVYYDVSDIPTSDVALVLGTSSLQMDGSPNPFFEKRMQTASNLYHMGKVKHILVSGDNATRYYNEPERMRNALVKLGIPAKSITLDYAGFRTLDSVVRSKEVFGQNNIIIITQSFHSYRALFISNAHGLDAKVMATEDVGLPNKVQLREYLARMLAVWDIYIVKKEPKFLGKKETLSI